MTYNTGNSAWYSNPRQLRSSSRQPLQQGIYLKNIHLDPQSSSKCSYSTLGTWRSIYSAKLRRTDHSTCSYLLRAFDVPSSLLLRSGNQYSILPAANRTKLEERMLRREIFGDFGKGWAVGEVLNRVVWKSRGVIFVEFVLIGRYVWSKGELDRRKVYYIFAEVLEFDLREICGVRFRKLRWRRWHSRRLW